MDKENNSTGSDKKDDQSWIWIMLATVAFIAIAAIIGSNAKQNREPHVMIQNPNNPNEVILMKPKKYEREVQKARKQQFELKKQQRLQEDEQSRKEMQKIIKENPGAYTRDTTFVIDGVEYQVVIE